MAEIGRLVGIETPVMNSLITLASVANGVDYSREGLTLEKMGLADAGPANVAAILRNGF
jgi:opine dehydrogenase